MANPKPLKDVVDAMPTPPPFPDVPDQEVLPLDATDEQRAASVAAYEQLQLDAQAQFEVAYHKYQADLQLWQDAQPVATIEDVREADDLLEGKLWIPEWSRNVVTRSLDREEYLELDKVCRDADMKLDVEQMGRRAMSIAVVAPKIADDEPMFKKHPMALKRIADDILEKTGVLGEVSAEVAAQFQG